MPDAPEPFSAFMARALHDPERGYYGRRIATVGARGDFSTSATLSPLLGQAIAAWLAEAARRQPRVRHIIEIGAGDGSLMRAVRGSLGWWRRRRWHWHVVDISAPLRQQQRLLLGRGVTWHNSLAQALQACAGGAFLYHNELLDALPVALLERRDDAWHEVRITAAGQESLQPLGWSERERRDFAALRGWQPQPGQRCELQTGVRDWLREWAPLWQEGEMLTLDYGGEFPELYHRRPRGTLRAYLLQQRLEGADVYANPGRQDITADINFTDYRAWTREQGWEEVANGTQAEFLRRRIRRLPSGPATAFLLDPDGAGGAFKFVIHRRLRR